MAPKDQLAARPAMPVKVSVAAALTLIVLIPVKPPVIDVSDPAKPVLSGTPFKPTT